LPGDKLRAVQERLKLRRHKGGGILKRCSRAVKPRVLKNSGVGNYSAG